MLKRTALVHLPRMLAAAVFAAACSDTVAPERRVPGIPLFDVASSDRVSGTIGQSGNVLIAGFPTNPHHGDALVATFFWLGSSNIIGSVTDLLANGTPVGNTYTQ